MGVVGVFEVLRDNGGVEVIRERLPCSCSLATFAAVGVLSGPKVKGGRLNGGRCFRLCDGEGSCSLFCMDVNELFRDVNLLCSLVGSGSTGIVMFLVA